MRLGEQRVARHHRHVALADLAGFKQAADAALRLNATRHHDEARGVLVEAVHHQRIGVNVLHALGQAVLLLRPTARHRQQAAGFFEHQQVFVFVNRVHV